MVGKQLSALLQILRSNGVAEYQLTQKDKDGKESIVTLRLGPVPVAGARVAPRTINVSPEALAAEAQAGGDADDDDEMDEEMGDMRFALERTTRKHFGDRRADPRKNKGLS